MRAVIQPPPDATTVSFPSSLPPLTNTNENNAAVTIPFHVNLISSTTPLFGPNPIATDCPYCQAHVVTSIQRIIGTFPWIIMGICFLLGFFLLIPWCLCCVPFYMDNCRDVVHSCPSCKRILGLDESIDYERITYVSNAAHSSGLSGPYGGESRKKPTVSRLRYAIRE
ncbi:Lipopolysaccharide-induced tumor necrosis factor-alpha factor [Dirofilaria immitis]